MAPDVWGMDPYRDGISRWYDKDDYTRVYITYGANGLKHSDRTRCRLWMVAHLSGEIIIERVGHHGIGDSVYFHFSEQADIVAFRLSEWGENALEWRT